MQRRDVGKTPSRETARPSAFAAVRPGRELKGWTKGWTQSWSKGWTQSGPSTSAHREVRRAWSQPRVVSGRNSEQDLHTPGLAPLAREVKSLYGAFRNPRASALIAAYFVERSFRFGRLRACRAGRANALEAQVGLGAEDIEVGVVVKAANAMLAGESRGSGPRAVGGGARLGPRQVQQQVFFSVRRQSERVRQRG
jgi:hypothetical protein